MKKLFFIVFSFFVLTNFVNAEKILTNRGYKEITSAMVGDSVLAYDINTGDTIWNIILDVQYWHSDSTEDYYSNHGAFYSYRINNKFKLYKEQSIWANGNVKHAAELHKGDIVYSDEDEPFEITSISKIDSTQQDHWWRFSISGDHSYIVDGITLHNASRFWVGGGSSANWSATSNTNWSATSGGSNNASVPGSSDDVIFNSGGNSNSTISATTTVLTYSATSGYTATITRNAALTVAGNFTVDKSVVWAGSSGLTISAASTITTTGYTAGNVFWNNALTFTNTNTKTLSSSTNDVKVSGAFTNSGTTTLNKTTSETFTLTGNLAGTTAISGTAKIILGGGTWSLTGAVSNSVDFAGNVTVSGTITYNGGTMTYVSGTITTTSSTLQTTGISSTVFNISGITWNNVTINAAGTYTFNSTFDISGNLTFGSNISTGTTTLTGSTINVGGNLTLNSLTSGAITGTTNVIMNGTGSISMSAITTGSFRNNIEFNTSGTITFSNDFMSGSPSIMKFTAGTFSFGSSAIMFIPVASTAGGTLTCNMSGLTIPLVHIHHSASISTGFTINGTNSFTIGTLNFNINGGNSNNTILKTGGGFVLTISTALQSYLNGTISDAVRPVLKSDVGGTQATLTLLAAATQNIERLNFTDIDGSGAQTIESFGGTTGVTISNCKNIISNPAAPQSITY